MQVSIVSISIRWMAGREGGAMAFYPRVEENTGVQGLFGISIPVWIYREYI